MSQVQAARLRGWAWAIGLLVASCAHASSGTEVRLGAVWAPTKSKPHPQRLTSWHRWQQWGEEPAKYSLEYALARSEASRIVDAVGSLKVETGYEEASQADNPYFKVSRLPQACRGIQPTDGTGLIRCTYGVLGKLSEPALLPLGNRLASRAKALGFDARQTAELIIGFVQQITYSKSHNMQWFAGVNPPAMVVAERLGDCDSKSLLAHMLLSQVGIRSALFLSRVHRHAVVGIALPIPGESRLVGGTRYVLAETTASLPIGRIHPNLLSPDDWRAIFVYRV